MVPVDEGQKHDVELAELAAGGETQLKAENDHDFVYVPNTAAERALVRKIDLHLLPILWLMYVFNYIDRSNIGNAKVGGMQADLKLSSSDYSLALSIFFVSYLLLEVPSNMILARTRPALYLPALMFIWGCTTIGVKGVDSLGGLIGIRIALGAIEAGFFPGVLLLLSCWYKPSELSKRLAFFYSASLISGAFSGLLAGGIIDGMEGLGGVRGWKWLFIIEGLVTCVVSVAAVFILPDYPSDTKWLSEEERTLAVHRLARAEEESEDVSHRQAFFQAIKDPRTYCFMVVLNFYASSGTISYFFPTLMTALNYKDRTAQFMTVPIYVCVLAIALLVGYSADRTGLKAYHVIAMSAIGTISFIICVVTTNPAVIYTFIVFGSSGIWAGLPVFYSWMVTMFDGREKRAISIALINGFGNLASIYGSFFWPSNSAPRYVMGFAITTALLAAIGVISAFNKWRFGDRGVAGFQAAQ